MRRSRRVGAGLLAAVLLAGTAAALDVPVVLVQQERDGARSRIVLRAPDGALAVITPDFFAAADPCVSFDGTRILFAGRREADDAWDVWETGADGTAPRRITSGLGDCREPIYLPRAAVDSPNFDHRVRWITFTATGEGHLDDQGAAPLTSLWATNLEEVPGRGTVLWRTTQNLGGDLAPTLLSDGRVLFSAGQRGALALMAMSWSGENLNPFYGSHDGLVSQIGAVETADSTVVFVEAETAARDAGGRLARVSRRRPLHSHEVLAEGRYRTPHPLPDGRLLVAHASDAGTWDVWLFDPERGERVEPIVDDPDRDDLDAMPLVPREEPPARIPTVEFASVLDVGSLRGLGQLQCLGVYETDRPEARVEPGSVRRVRFVQGLPLPLPDGEPEFADDPPDTNWPPRGVRTRTLGEAPVEEDGSFYVNVAADVPFYLETLDAEGNVLQTMRTWLWVRAGDQRGCVGCHEDKELAPANRASQALLRAEPTLLLPESRQAARGEVRP